MLTVNYFPSQYLNQGTIKDKNLDDVKDFRLMDDAMNRVGFSSDEKNNIYRVIAAVLHLGNIAFQEDDSTQGW